MSRSAHPKLLTCRYWALGPACPNVNDRGVHICAYAHWDTGLLASSFQQRGTCTSWMEHRCHLGSECWYEHRHTGVSGLYQGVVKLHGLNLEIADAASRGGFNTFNHEALMNLIWSMRRVILRNSGTSKNIIRLPPPLKDPIYPDRYRPSGRGDNTKRKRHLPPTDSPPPFHSIKPLGGFRDRHNRIADKPRKILAAKSMKQVKGGHISQMKPKNLTVKQEGTQEQPIILLSDDEVNSIWEETKSTPKTADRTAKRRKTKANHMGRCKVESPTPENALTATVPKKQQPSTTAEMTSILLSVKAVLEKVKRRTDRCQMTMKDLFDRNNSSLGQDGIFGTMTKLSSELFKAHDGARDGIVETDRAVNWLEGNHNIKDER